MVAIPLVIYWSLALWGLISARPILIYLFTASLSFGALAVIPTEVTGGLTFAPGTMTGVLIVAKTFANTQRARIALATALSFRRGALLSAFWIVAVVVTIFAPSLFAGRIMVISLKVTEAGQSPLAPSIQNISQLAYLTISVLITFAFAQTLKSPERRQTLLNALVFGAFVAVMTGLIDYASQFIPIGPFLEMFRTASYALLVDAELLGGKRVVGLMPEASSFGSLCISYICLLYFLRRGMADQRIRDVCVPPLLGMLMLLAYISTSSAAYVGLAVFLFMATFEWVMRATERQYNPLRRRYLGIEFSLVVAGTALVALLLLFEPTVLDKVVGAVDEMVFKKSETSSFVERNMWTAVSLEALWDSYGFGVGLGATRASNVLVATFSNVGILGGLLFYAFVMQSLLRRSDPADREGAVIQSGLRYGLAPSFVVALLIGTTADFGPQGALRYGLMMAIGAGGLSYQFRRRRAQRLLSAAY